MQPLFPFKPASILESQFSTIHTKLHSGGDGVLIIVLPYSYECFRRLFSLVRLHVLSNRDPQLSDELMVGEPLGCSADGPFLIGRVKTE
jgi:hypothetical protein